VGDILMLSKGKYIKLKDREIDLLLLKLLTIYVDYDLCEALLLIAPKHGTDVKLMEVSTPELDDVVRTEDDYDRAN
jgi:hypothetical protein